MNTINKIKQQLILPEYDFLRNETSLANNIAILTIGGSYAYGTNNENSDIDIRGVTLETKEVLIGMNNNFEQYIDTKTDTTIYGFNKFVKLLLNCNPNVCELLGNKSEHYLYLSPIGQELIDNSHLFLSKKAIHSFGGYANQQLRRLENKSNRLVGQSQNEEHIYKTIEHAAYDFKNRYFTMPEDAIKLYIDKAVQEGYDTEIFMDVNLSHYPLRDYKGMWSEMQSIVKAYGKIGKRNEKAIEHNKLGKHMMHLIRLYMMCLDILENEKIVTYREKEHNLLMDIRNGKYLDSNRQPIAEFYEMVDEYEKKLEYAKENSSLPSVPDYKRINEFVMSVNERVVKGEING